MCCFLSMNLKEFFHEFNPSKFVLYFSLLLFVILLGFRLDNFITCNYFIVFLPLWIWKILVFSGLIVGAMVWFKHPEYRRENNDDIQAMAISCAFHVLLLFFELMMCVNLQYAVINYVVAFIPIYCMSVFAIIACVWGYRHERQLELETFFLVNIIQFICISLRWDGIIGWSWVVVFVPFWVILTLLSVCVLYYITWALLFMRSPDISASQRKTHVVNAIMSCSIVIPLLAFTVILSRKLDNYVNSYFTAVFVPLEFSLLFLVMSSFCQKGGNQWWFGMRKDFCEFILDTFPLLREYGNISYKFTDTLVSSANSNSSDSSLSIPPLQDNNRRKEQQRLAGAVHYIDVPD